ncbi:DUF742 domain-containing protein [Pseudonocardia hydrocarbonoxydans]|nr:DUF742 domain-containing protein [Pseudonocardia hydrocarbonoxydans]
MADPADDPGPEVGLTGARFAGASRARRGRRPAPVDPVPADPVPVDAAPGDTAPAVPDDGSVGLTGARFGGSSRRRRERLRAEEERVERLRAPAPAPVPVPAPAPAPPPVVEAPAEPSPYAIVRPYVLTGGRTRAGVSFAVEALVTATGPGHAGEPVDHTRIRALCRGPRSVAEVAALLEVPLGVVQVLLGDMLAAGAVRVHRTADAGGPDLALMERVLAGLRRL